MKVAKNNKTRPVPVSNAEEEQVMQADPGQTSTAAEIVATAATPAVSPQEQTTEVVETEAETTAAETLSEAEIAELEEEPEVVAEKTEREKLKSKYSKSVKLEPMVYQALKEFHLAAAGDPPDETKWETPLAWPQLGKTVREWLGNLNSRGLLEAKINEENGGVDSVKLTQRGYDSFRLVDETGQEELKKAPGRKANGDKAKTKSTVTRATGVDPHARIRILVGKNPRRENTQGYEAYKLYRDGMTYREYLDAEYDNTILCGDKEFKGPLSAHFKWDLMNGYIGLYDDREEEVDPATGNENPKYWINSSKWVRENLSAVRGGATE